MKLGVVSSSSSSLRPSLLAALAVPIALAGALSACASASGSPPTSDPAPSDPAAPLQGSDGGASTTDASWGAGVESVTTSIGPIDVTVANPETTVCITRRLTNDEDLVVSGYTVDLSPGSHHLLVYSVPDTEENLTPTPCHPFQGFTNEPIVFANEEHIDWSFPEGVAFELPARQMVRIEGHFIDTTATDLQGSGTVTLRGWPKSSAPAWQKADALFYGTTHIDIPPGAAFSTGPLFQAGPPGTHYISVTTHQHRLGTGVQVWTSRQAGVLGDRVANDTDWSDPSWRLLPTPFDFDGTSGITFQCDWFNSTDQSVTFGESALAEMCFAGGYYYPGKGFHVCVDGQCGYL